MRIRSKRTTKLTADTNRSSSSLKRIRLNNALNDNTERQEKTVALIFLLFGHTICYKVLSADEGVLNGFIEKYKKLVRHNIDMYTSYKLSIVYLTVQVIDVIIISLENTNKERSAV